MQDQIQVLIAKMDDLTATDSGLYEGGFLSVSSSVFLNTIKGVNPVNTDLTSNERCVNGVCDNTNNSQVCDNTSGCFIAPIGQSPSI